METDPRQYIEASMNGLREQTAAHQNAWNFGNEQRWDANLETGELTFTFADGTTATAPFQIVGTYDSENGTFLWGWDHPSVTGTLRTAAVLAQDWGAINDIEAYTSRALKCTEHAVWEFTAVAARLAGASGAYRGASGPTMIFMTFGAVTVKGVERAEIGERK